MIICHVILYFIFKSQIYIKKESERCDEQHQLDKKLDKGKDVKNIYKRKIVKMSSILNINKRSMARSEESYLLVLKIARHHSILNCSGLLGGRVYSANLIIIEFWAKPLTNENMRNMLDNPVAVSFVWFNAVNKFI
jgi:hypothetical protein